MAQWGNPPEMQQPQEMKIQSLGQEVSLEWDMATESSIQFSSVAQSCLTLQPHELQHARPAIKQVSV